ncbi:peptidylprolyl isomerase [Neptunomonas phycophila]|uniref:peptidylprolyl isomerase n=1 Tax=Neptunomonas phycophila TaxID=1572645 RepID=A0ABT9ER65_9GAMM|nr:peptidylprolyl isomerase [Neptunomonas phycophila]MDP2521252.1 peptidylprolyl isomerase [Neptunomonas phycophila]
MLVAKNTVVRFSYQLKDQAGELLEATDEGKPVAYLHGHNGLMPALEAEFEGKAAGDSFSATLAPVDAFGERDDSAVHRVPAKHLQGAEPGQKQWKPGMVALLETEEGKRQVTVVKVGKFMVTVDVNHPLSGKTVTFEIGIEDVREATAEEIQHGHAHGEGGHHH